MPDVLVRGIDETVLEKIKDKAKRHHRSLQAELMTIITRASQQPNPLTELELMRKIRAANTKVNKSDSADLLREDRDR
jgi:plasmid stability protein